MELYYGLVSGNSSRALFGLIESGVAAKAIAVDTRAGENKTPEYLALNPMGKVPALRDGAFSLWESNAINTYFAETAQRLLPKAPQARAAVLRWMFFQSAHISPAAIPIFREINSTVRAYYSPPPNPAAAEAGRKELQRFLPVLDEAMRGKEWLEGEFSLADIANAPHLLILREGGFDYAPWPGVRAWLDRAEARPAWREARGKVFG